MLPDRFLNGNDFFENPNGFFEAELIRNQRFERFFETDFDKNQNPIRKQIKKTITQQLTT